MSLFFNHLISLVDSTLQLDILADSFKSYFPRMKDFDPSNENQAMWYLSPKQQLVETILLFLTLTPMLYFLTKASSPWKVAVPSFPAKSTGSYGTTFLTRSQYAHLVVDFSSSYDSLQNPGQ